MHTLIICTNTHGIICIFSFVEELLQNMKVQGTKVVRGQGWVSGDEDGKSSSAITPVGTVEVALYGDGKVIVGWPNGERCYHKMGDGGKYELQLAGD